MRLLLLIFFFLSGACGLIYEVVWTKLFVFAMGGTTYAISTVLAAFMGGLALGSWLGGKWIDRRGAPFLLYGLIEGGIGFYCLFIPFSVGLIPSILGPLYDQYYTSNPIVFGFLRFILSVTILIIPTALMGASLPVLARYFATQKSRFGWEVGRLFTINTFGACLGSFSAGFLLLPLLGKKLTIHIAAGANIGICVAVLLSWFLHERKHFGKPAAEPEEKAGDLKQGDNLSTLRWGRAVFWAALFLYAANGFAGMAYQVAWNAALTLSLGSSTYSFTIIVTVFILGLALGGGIGARLSDRLKNPAVVLGWVEVSIGFISLWAMWGLGQLPEWTATVISRFFGSWRNVVSAEFLLVAFLLLMPTILMGLVFPLAVKTISLCRQGVGETVGVAYGWNTAGAILGSLTAGFVLIPIIGLQNTITAANMVNWVAGAILLGVIGTSGLAGRTARIALPIAAGIILTGLIPRWNPGIMSSGPSIYARTSDKSAIYINPMFIKFYKEGVDATVTVIWYDAENIFLRVNGKTDASSDSDMLTQELLAQIPMMVHLNPKNVCIVGLASGVTLGSVLRYPVESVDAVEISPLVVEAARYFDNWNHNALDDPRTKIIVGDGRNHLLMTRKRYDVIISEPSNPWIAGESTLFTKEYFELARDRLSPDGVFCFWVQGYDISSDEFTMLMRTFQSVFPEATLWEPLNTADYMVVGSLAPIKFDLKTLESRIQQPKVLEDLKRVYVSNAAEFFPKFIMGPVSFKKAAGEGEIHVDDKLQMEYKAPRHLYYTSNFYPELYRKIIRQKDKPQVIISPEEKDWPPDFKNALSKEMLAAELIQSGQYYRIVGPLLTAFENIEMAILLSPDNGWYKELVSMICDTLMNYYMKRDMIKEAIEMCRKAAGLNPKSAIVLDNLGIVLFHAGKYEEARTEFTKVVEIEADNFAAIHFIGDIDLQEGNIQSAKDMFRRAIDLNPYYSPSFVGLGLVAEAQKNYDEAEDNFRKAIKLNPKNAVAYARLGKLLLSPEGGNKSRAGKCYLEKAFTLNPGLRSDAEFRGFLEE